MKQLTISCILFFSVSSITFSQNLTESDSLKYGIAKIIKNDEVLAESFKQGAVYTIAYLNQLEPELKGYASFSFEEKGTWLQRFIT